MCITPVCWMRWGWRGCRNQHIPKPFLSCTAVPTQLMRAGAGLHPAPCLDGTSSALGKRLGFLPCLSFTDVRHLPSSWDMSYYLCRALHFSEEMYLLPCRSLQAVSYGKHPGAYRDTCRSSVFWIWSLLLRDQMCNLLCRWLRSVGLADTCIWRQREAAIPCRQVDMSSPR